MTCTTGTFWRERARILTARTIELESALRIAVGLRPELLNVSTIADTLAELESARP